MPTETTLSRYAPRVLDFDIENRPLTYWFDDKCTAEITAIACSFGPKEDMYCWLLGRDDPREMHEEFEALYRDADMITGHYIRKHDLPIINGSRLEYGLKPLPEQLTCDTRIDLVSIKDMPQSQEALGNMLGIRAPKVQMSQSKWRAANRLQSIELTEKRVVGDVRQHQQLRLKLLEMGLLRPPRRWSVGVGR